VQQVAKIFQKISASVAVHGLHSRKGYCNKLTARVTCYCLKCMKMEAAYAVARYGRSSYIGVRRTCNNMITCKSVTEIKVIFRYMILLP